MTFDASEERHSAAFFNPQRDFWWNDDYLRLLAARFGLSDVRSVLEVGSGVGHWGTLLLPLLSPDATLVGSSVIRDGSPTLNVARQSWASLIGAATCRGSVRRCRSRLKRLAWSPVRPS